MTQMITRRGLIAGLGALSLAAAAGCNASANDGAGAAPASSDAAQAFTWTDGRDKTIDLSSIPQVVVAQSSAAAALWDFGYQVKGAYGELKETDGKLGFQAGNIDLSKITVIGSTYGEFDVEKYAAMGPQLLIDLNFTAGQLWYIPENVVTKVEALAPTLGVEMLNLNLLQIVEQFAKLAGALGADLNASAVTESKASFETSVEQVKAAVAAKPDLTVLGLSVGENAFVANPKQHPDFAYLESLGVTFVQAGGKATDYFSEVSWEKIDDYAADIIYLDSRNPANRETALKQPTYAALPAVKASQVYDWKAAAPYSYLASAPIFAEFATNLQAAKAV